ncbi:MAG: hypothetical protein P1U89_26070 [Verrucomicrobiales bacterium]|nr:hypothetical protein [Verrucomicrobiales bacterium]
MKKLLLAAVAVIAVGSASNSFAGGCGTSYVAVQPSYYTPQTTYVVQEQHHHQVVSVPVHQPVHIEKKVIVQKPVVTTTYTKPCVQTYKVHTPVYYNYTPVYNHHYTTSYGY